MSQQDCLDVNQDDISNDIAATEFVTTYETLCHSPYATPEYLLAAVDGLVDTLTNCVTKVATLNEILRHVVDYVAVGPEAHYISASLLSQLVEKYTREVEGTTFSRLVFSNLQMISESCVTMVEQLSNGEAPRDLVQVGRNLAIFYSDVISKLLILPSFKTWFAPLIIGLESIVSAFMADLHGIPRDDLLENSQCAISMIKLAGPAVDQVTREDAPVSQRVGNVVTKLYDGVRRVLISSNDLSPGVRTGIIRVLEFRASRWGEFPSPDQPLYHSDPMGVDEVDPIFQGGGLSREETDFLNGAVDELNLDDEDDNGGVNAYNQENDYYNQGEGDYDQQYGDVDRRPVWEREELPPGAMEEFRLSLKPKFEPDGAGDR